jgi:hypothetical protein
MHARFCKTPTACFSRDATSSSCALFFQCCPLDSALWFSVALARLSFRVDDLFIFILILMIDFERVDVSLPRIFVLYSLCIHFVFVLHGTVSIKKFLNVLLIDSMLCAFAVSNWLGQGWQGVYHFSNLVKEQNVCFSVFIATQTPLHVSAFLLCACHSTFYSLSQTMSGASFFVVLSCPGSRFLSAKRGGRQCVEDIGIFHTQWRVHFSFGYAL